MPSDAFWCLPVPRLVSSHSGPGLASQLGRILNALRPSASTRQTLLFSATLPKDVLAVAKFATRDALLVDTVGDEEQQTNEHVPQCATVTPLKAQAAELLALLRALKRGATPHKIVVFFATARLTQLYAEAFAQCAAPPRRRAVFPEIAPWVFSPSRARRPRR